MEMPSFLQSKEVFENASSTGGKKKLFSIVVLIILLLAIPLTVWIAQKTAIFAPKASGEAIELVSGSNSCVVSTNPNKVSCTSFPIKLTSPLGPPAQPVGCTSDSQCSANQYCSHKANYPGNCIDSNLACAQAVVRACSLSNPSQCDDFSVCSIPPGWSTVSTASPSASGSASLKEDIANPFTSKLIAKGKSIFDAIATGFTVKNVSAQTTDVILTASPNPCSITSGATCTSTITWNARNRTDVKITIRESPGSLFATGASGSQAAPWIGPTGATFDLYSGSTLLKSLSVTGTSLISASPTVCNIPQGGETCSSTISWNAGSNTNVKITVRESPGSLFASGVSGSQVAPWIRTSGATFDLYSGSNVIGSVFVKGVVGGSPAPSAGLGLITASPNPCTLVSGSETCSSTISWNAGSRTDVKISIREAPGSLFASGVSGSQAAPWIRATGATFDLYSGATLLDSIFVKGLSQNSSATPSANPSGIGTVSYKIAETEAGLATAQAIPYPGTVITSFSFGNSTPGAKQIWAEFIGIDGSSRKEHISVELVDPDPVITSLDCSMDISKQNLKLTLNGSKLGNGSGKVTVDTKEAQIVSWGDKQVTATIKPSGSLEDGKLFKAILTRSDGKALPEITCLVNTSLISLGARLFCREPGKFDVSGVKVTLVDESGNKVNEEVSIDKDGLVKGLKTKLQTGKRYSISVKAPYSLRRNAFFTASNGTNLVTPEDGSSFILPVGDIAPTILSDGKINTLDHAEIVRQWSILASSTKTGDFNKDSRVNSIDWACMRYDFNKEDDSIPSTSAPATSPSPASTSTTIPISSSTPLPSSSAGQRSAYFLLNPVGGSSYPNDDEFIVNINLWSQLEASNLFVAKLSFDPAALQVSRIEKGTTLTSWAEDFFDNQTGTISLAAGLPTPGLKTTEGNDPVMAKIIFKGKKVGTTTLSITADSKIYSNSDNSNILTSLLSTQIAITN